MTISKIKIKVVGERSSGRTQVLNILQEALRTTPQVLSINELRKADHHELSIVFETDPDLATVHLKGA